MTHLNDIAYVDTLQLQTASGDSAPTIFANGIHQVAVVVTVKAVTEDSRPMTKVDEMRKGLFLCFADDDERLTWKEDGEWTYTDEKGEYNGGGKTGTSSTIVADDGTMIFKWFVSSKIVEIRRISAGLKTGTKLFSTADNSSGAEKSSVRVEARPPIDYSDRNNIDIKLGAFVRMSSNVRWQSGSTDYSNGTVRRRIVYIHPSSRTDQTKFKYYSILYSGLDDDDFGSGADLTFGRRRPCSVIGRSQKDENFQISLWYKWNDNVDIDGTADVESSGSRYTLKLKMDRDPLFDIEKLGIPTLLLYQFSFPIGHKTKHYQWQNKTNAVNVDLTDFYGNTGLLHLTFDDDSSFEEPGLI